MRVFSWVALYCLSAFYLVDFYHSVFWAGVLTLARTVFVHCLYCDSDQSLSFDHSAHFQLKIQRLLLPLQEMGFLLCWPFIHFLSLP